MDKVAEMKKMLAELNPEQLREIRELIAGIKTIYASGEKPEIAAMERSLKLLGLAGKLAEKGIESERVERDGVTTMLKIKGGKE